MSFWYYCLDKNTNEIISGFLPWNFLNLPGASWKLFGASCRLPCLWYYIPSPQEAQRASMKPPGSYKKNSGQKSRNNFVGIFVQTIKPKGHFEINWPLSMSILKSTGYWLLAKKILIMYSFHENLQPILPFTLEINATWKPFYVGIIVLNKHKGWSSCTLPIFDKMKKKWGHFAKRIT